jgi:hypothetical protein
MPAVGRVQGGCIYHARGTGKADTAGQGHEKVGLGTNHDSTGHGAGPTLCLLFAT